MEKLVLIESKYSVQRISDEELMMIYGGDGVWSSFWKWAGKKVGGTTIICMDNYDQEAALEAIKNYGSPL